MSNKKQKKTEASLYIFIVRNLGLLFLFHVLFSISHINNVSSIILKSFCIYCLLVNILSTFLFQKILCYFMSLLLYCVRLPVVDVSYIILASHGFEPVGLRLNFKCCEKREM